MQGKYITCRFQSARRVKNESGKPLRMALGSLLIQKQLGFSDRELVEEIMENPYFQYFIGLPGYQTEAPFVPSILVEIRKRLTDDVLSDYLNLARCKKRTSKKIRKAIRQQLQYIRRDRNNLAYCREHTRCKQYEFMLINIQNNNPENSACC